MRTALVTGSNSGIGLACAKVFLEQGFKVIAHYHSSKENLEKIDSNNLEFIQADLSDLTKLESIFAPFKNHVDILINNAGTYFKAESLEKTSIKDVIQNFNVNVFAAFEISRMIAPHMAQKKWGRIINISSIGVKYGGNPKSAAYTMSKSALEIMGQSFSKEYCETGVLVNNLRVGVTDTKFHALNKNKNMDGRINMIPMKRMANPEEVAKTVKFLCSDENTYITGSTVTISGGE